MRNILYIVFSACTLFACCQTVSANPSNITDSKAMSAQEVDAAFDRIFARQQKLTRLEAKIVTEKKGGGIFKRSVKTWGQAYAQMPSYLKFVDRGEVKKNLPVSKAATILIDGTYLWDIKPGDTDGSFDAERMSVRSTGDRDINIAALLIGANVASGKELRRHYLLTGSLEKYADNTQSYHFTLKTIPGREKRKVKENVDVWIRPGEVVPWKITSVRLSPKGANPFSQKAATGFKRTESTKYISELKTNLSASPLPPFAPSTFWFGTFLKENPQTRVMNTKGQIISGDILQADLNDVYSKLKNLN